MKLTVLIGLLLAVGLCRAADVPQVRRLIEGILDETDDALIPKLTQSLTSEMDETIQRSTAEEVTTLLPLAQKCLISPRPNVRTSAFLLMFSVSMRPDSTKLLAPYIEALAAVLRQADPPSRRAAIIILGSTLPAPSPRALLYLAAHLNDKNTPVEEIGTSAAGLLKPSHPFDPATLQNVLSVVHERGDRSLTIAILEQVGLYQITHEEAQKFIRSGLMDSDHFVRHAAVEAAGRMSGEIKRKFMPDVARIAQNPDETPETRSLAETVLRQ